MKDATILLACLVLILPANASPIPADATVQGLVGGIPSQWLQNGSLPSCAEDGADRQLLDKFLAPGGPASTVYYVDGVCGDDAWTGQKRPCTALDGPKRTIQAAVDAAANGDVIIVLPATYVENIVIRNKNLIIAGLPAEQAIVDGNATGRVFAITNSDVSIYGLVVQNGKAVNPPIGGGLYCNNSNLVMVKSVIKDNTAQGAGGGILIFGGDITLRCCKVAGNTVIGGPSGSGAGLTGGGPGSTLLHCIFQQNQITMNGGGAGVYNFAGRIEDCIITDNHITFEATADGGGGLSRCTGPIVRSVISDNSVEFGNGGGIAKSSGPIIACIITGNRAYSGIGDVIPVYGGGLADCSGPIVNCLIAKNVSQNTDGAFPPTESRGGGLGACTGPITNCTIVHNEAIPNSHGSCGGGLWDCTGTITNCIIWGNTATRDAQLCDSSTTTYTCIQDWAGADAGNIATDPMFVNADGDWRLRPHSPCIDAADNTALDATIVTDCAGGPRCIDDPRTRDTGKGTVPVVDMGAYEYASTCGDLTHPYPLMDFNHDCITDLADLAIFCTHWLESTL